MRYLALILLGLPFFSSAQSIDVFVDNTAIEFSGGTHTVATNMNDNATVVLLIQNNTAIDYSWSIERILPNVQYWQEGNFSMYSYSDPFNGLVYQMPPDPTWETPGSVTVPSGDSAMLQLTYQPDQSGCDLYTYYIIDNNIRLDSFNIELCKTVGLPELIEESVTIYPSPTNSILNVAFENLVPDELSIHDLLGNEVARLGAKKSMTIPVDKFTPGVYILSAEIEGVLFKRKFQVQH